MKRILSFTILLIAGLLFLPTTKAVEAQQCMGWGEQCFLSAHAEPCCSSLHCGLIINKMGICLKDDGSISDGNACVADSECKSGNCYERICSSYMRLPVLLDWPDISGAESYYVRILRDGEIIYNSGVQKDEDGDLLSFIEFEPDYLRIFFPLTTYSWEVAACFNERGTNCGASCTTEQGPEECADFISRKSFTVEPKPITAPKLKEPLYDPGEPEDIPTVNISDVLQWEPTIEYEDLSKEEEDEIIEDPNRSLSIKEQHGWWAQSFYYEVKKDGESVVGPTLTTSTRVSFEDVWTLLEYGTEYSWHVKGCLKKNGANCSDYTQGWLFKTTGSVPGNRQTNTTDIPVVLSWDTVEGAEVYKYQVFRPALPSPVKVVEKTTTQPQALIDYPEIKTSSFYQWRVQSCADSEGSLCGNWSPLQDITTLALIAPSNPFPEDGGEISPFENRIWWSEVAGADFYRYKVRHISKPPEEKREGCGNIPSETVPPKIVSKNSDLLFTKCLGEYEWQVQACVDEKCEEAGPWVTPPWRFEYLASEETEGGLIPCGRYSDNIKTPWDERDNCQFKHLFILFKTLLDFVLWKLAPAALILLLILSGVVAYSSLGGTTSALSALKSIWLGALKGYGAIFLGWNFLNIVLKLLGITDSWWIVIF